MPDQYDYPPASAIPSAEISLITAADFHDATSRVPALNILIMVGGTRGDVQPSVTLGRELLRLGHRVRLAAPANFRSFVQGNGLEFYPLAGDNKWMMEVTVKWGGMLPTTFGDMGRLRREIQAIMYSTWEACTKADPEDTHKRGFHPELVIANQLAYGQVHCAERLGVPLHMIYTIPWLPTTAFPHPFARGYGRNLVDWCRPLLSAALWPLRFTKELRRCIGDPLQQFALARLNWLSTPLLDHTAWWGIMDVHARFRSTIGLPVLGWNNTGWALYSKPSTFLFSPSLVPPPPEWKRPDVTVAGFLHLDQRSTWTPPRRLLEFLEAGPAPVYIGFGSMITDAPEKLTALVLRAVRQAGVRAVVLAGWAGIGQGADAGGGTQEAPGNEDVLMISEVAHDWLFPRCSALVHHGGVGTTAAGLLAGCPTFVVPFFGDLYFWGDICTHLGVGPPAVPHDQLTADKLAAALRDLQQPERKAAAEAAAAQLQREDGLKRAVAAIHRTAKLPISSMKCLQSIST